MIRLLDLFLMSCSAFRSIAPCRTPTATSPHPRRNVIGCTYIIVLFPFHIVRSSILAIKQTSFFFYLFSLVSHAGALSSDVFAQYYRHQGNNAVYICRRTDEYVWGTATETKSMEEKCRAPKEICNKYHSWLIIWSIEPVLMVIWS